MIFPSSIRFFSVPSIVFATLFLWNAFFYLVVSKLPRPVKEYSLKYFYFSLLCLFLGFYSIATCFLYSSENFEQARIWEATQVLILFPGFIFFILFLIKYLDLRSWYWRIFLPAFTLVLMAGSLLPGALITHEPCPKTFVFFNHSTRIYEVELGPLAAFFFAWSIIHLLGLGLYWLKKFWISPRRHLHFIAYAIFVLACVNDGLVSAGFHSFYYLIELGFLAYIFGMGSQMFQEYVENSEQILIKSAALEKLNRETRFLMSALSHDLTAPLFSIQGFVDQLKEAPHQANPHVLMRLDANAQHLKTLFDDLINFLKAGRVYHPKESISIQVLLQEILMTLETSQSFPRVEIELPQAEIHWWGDRVYLKQILMNLLQNALKHAEQPDALIKIQAELRNNDLWCSVTDTGPGIPEELREKVFEPFFQADFREPGKGLGLAIVKKLVENEGGQVWVDAEYVKGTRIWIKLPHKIDSNDAEDFKKNGQL